MATVKVTLNTGLITIDGTTNKETTHLEAVLREPTAADLIEATEESEKLMLSADDGYQLVSSPTLLGIHVLRRQIVSIGEHPGPLTLGEIRKLTALDLKLLQKKAMELEAGVMRELGSRGRD